MMKMDIIPKDQRRESSISSGISISKQLLLEGGTYKELILIDNSKETPIQQKTRLPSINKSLRITDE